MFKKLTGILSTLKIGGATGPLLKNSSGVLQIRNTGDSAFANLSIANPTSDAHAATRYNSRTDSTSKQHFIVASGIDDGNLPTNTSTAKYMIVTQTTGGDGLTVGDLVYDNGSNTGDAERIPAKKGYTVIAGGTITGTTVSLVANRVYSWSGTAWEVPVDITDTSDLDGMIRIASLAFDHTSTTVTATASFPENSIVLSADVVVSEAFDGTTPTLTVGKSGSLTLLQAATDNDLTSVETWSNEQYTAFGNAAPVLTVSSGSSTNGAGTVYIRYAVPKALTE